MYTPVEDRSEQGSQPSEDYDQLLSKESQDFNPSFRKTSRHPNLLHIFLTLIISLFTFALGTWLGSHKLSEPTSQQYLEHVQKYSPILKEVDTSMHMVQFNGSFMKENAFRQGAGPEVDAAWDSIGVNCTSFLLSPFAQTHLAPPDRSIAIPVSEAAASGLAPDQVQINPVHGGGFPANIEGLHHLHCLNLLRQSLYFNYDYYKNEGKGAFVNEDNIVRFHVTHCMDIIRQQLMCMPDTGVLGQVWWDPAAPKAFVDFNTQHKCKDFEAIRRWAEERQIPAEVPSDFLQPPKEGDRIFEQIP
ncbi:Oxidase ustYa [Lachnellula suecica]|uniref:Oxidase ustYa n=1 Tax=Lachnellula suecica TaxID=602035 RepID=A0A8T9BWI2_9HELO|nr:Oxidase ustYa [Lachnellula suecica]